MNQLEIVPLARYLDYETGALLCRCHQAVSYENESEDTHGESFTASQWDFLA